MKVLIISAEVWQDGANGGNVLSNIFSGTNFEFAQIYCNPGLPQNSLCKKYYQMTDAMAIKNVFKHKPMGMQFEIDFESILEKNQQICEQPNKKFYTFFHKHRLGIFYSVRSFFWNLSKWKNDRIKKFIDDFNPDIIFAPCYANIFMQKLTRFVANYTGKKVVSYISDDNYTLKQFHISPFYWIKRFALRRQIRKTFKYYSLCYTMTDEQKTQLENDLNAKMKILRKSASFSDVSEKNIINEPIKIVYAGGVYLNRWKTILSLKKAIDSINKKGQLFRLDIYTNNETSKKISKNLDDKINSFIHKAVSMEELAQIYKNSDIALHVESFDLKNKLAVRLSFSTKIVDCLSSGCAVMAICDEKQAGLKYLKQEDCAICVSNKNELLNKLEEIANNKQIIVDYSKRAYACLVKNHSKQQNLEMIKNDFEKILR